MLIPLSLLALGLILLIVGAYYLVDGASAIARKYGLSELVIGLTVVAFGTSMPELIVNVVSATAGKGQVAFANVIGSNNFNLLVILGCSGLIMPLAIQFNTIWKEIPLSFFAVVLLWVLANEPFLAGFESVTRFEGILLVLCFGVFMVYIFRQIKKEPETDTEQTGKNRPLLQSIFWITGSLLLLIGGGKLLVNNATHLAQAWGVSEYVIGITIVAAGTSLPELATSIVAAFRKNNGIAIGNVIGSNIFNIFFILGLTAIVRPLEYDPAFNKDIYLLGGSTILLFLICWIGASKSLSRIEAGLLLFIYACYTGYLFTIG